MPPSSPVPAEIRLTKDRRSLKIAFDNGASFDLPAEYLRVLSPSAEVQGHSPAERRVIGGKKDVEIVQVAPVGRYAVRIVFSDRHDTGIYSWPYLWALASEREERWSAYLAELAGRGLSREAPGRAD